METRSETDCEIDSGESSCEELSKIKRNGVTFGYTGSFSKPASPLDRFLLTTSARKAESEFNTKWIFNPSNCPVKVLNRKQIKSDFMEITGRSMELLEQVREDAPSRRRSERIKESFSFGLISLSDYLFDSESEKMEDEYVEPSGSFSDSEVPKSTKFLNGKRKRQEKPFTKKKRRALNGKRTQPNKAEDSSIVEDSSSVPTVSEITQTTLGATSKGYCICNAVDYDGSFMIQCEKCDIWYHGDCIGLKEDDAEGIECFICKFCPGASNLPYIQAETSKADSSPQTTIDSRGETVDTRSETPESTEDSEVESGSSMNKDLDNDLISRKSLYVQPMVHQLSGVTV